MVSKTPLSKISSESPNKDNPSKRFTLEPGCLGCVVSCRGRGEVDDKENNHGDSNQNSQDKRTPFVVVEIAPRTLPEGKGRIAKEAKCDYRKDYRYCAVGGTKYSFTDYPNSKEADAAGNPIQIGSFGQALPTLVCKIGAGLRSLDLQLCLKLR